MGSVHAAIDETTGARVAVKILHGEVLKDGSSKDDASKLGRFQREARASASVQSAHIAAMLDWGNDEKTSQPFMVMELLEGEDLQQLLKRAQVLPPDVVLRIAAQACQGLCDAHDARIMHRDIKPANLFLARAAGGEVAIKLLDFGIAKFRPTAGEDVGETTNLTNTGSMLGSPRYMSPEQARGRSSIDHRTDLWSLGVVMYRALTGHMPHEDAEAMGDFIVLLCSELPRSIHAHAPWVPPEIVSLVEGALQIDREKRYPTAQAMLEAIRVFLPKGDRLALTDLVALPESARGAAAPARPDPRSGASSIDATVPLPTGRAARLAAAPREGAPTGRRDDAGTPGALASTQNETRDDPVKTSGRGATPFVIGAAVLVAAVGTVAVLSGTDVLSGGGATAASGVTTASPAARRASLVIVPGDAAVEVDGAKVAAQDGIVELAGAVGKVFHVRVSRDGQEKTIDVVLGEAGAEPPKVELVAPPPTGATAATAPGPATTAAGSPSARPSASPTTKKTASPAPSAAPTPGKNPLMPEKFE
jgi:hypothetical protein